MLRRGSHDVETLIRYAEDSLSESKKHRLEKHLQDCTSCREFLAFTKDFNEGLRAAKLQFTTADEECPDSSLLVGLEADELDEEIAQHVRAHMLFCEDCRQIFFALEGLRPRRIEAILRVARWLIDCLRISEEAVWQPLPATAELRGTKAIFAAPFQVSQILFDPDTGKEITVAVQVENDLPVEEELTTEQIRIKLKSKPVPNKWRVSLSDSEKELVDKRLKAKVTVREGLPHGFYVVRIYKEEEDPSSPDESEYNEENLFGEFTFVIEPFSLPEAVEAILEYLGLRDYGRALAIVESAIDRYPENQDLWDLRALARAQASSDLEKTAEGELRGGVRAFLTEVGRVAKFVESLASMVAAATQEPSILTGEVASQIQREAPSLPVLQGSIALIDERLKSIQERQDEQFKDIVDRQDEQLKRFQEGQDRLVGICDDLRSRFEQFVGLMETLQSSIDKIRTDTKRNVDEKFAAIGDALGHFTNDVPRQGLSLPNYESVFYEKLGEDCWSWLEPEVRKIVISAEDIYRYVGSMPALEVPDLSAPLLQLCRGFELLINIKLTRLCSKITTTVAQNSELLHLAIKKLPAVKVVEKLEEVKKALERNRSLSLAQIAMLLFMQKVIQQEKPGAFGTESAGLHAIEFIVPLAQIGKEFRNGKIHPTPGSPSLFTTPEEMQCLRKLVFGLDEYRIDSSDFLNRLGSGKWWWFSQVELAEVREKLSSSWSEFPGLVNILWGSLGDSNRHIESVEE